MQETLEKIINKLDRIGNPVKTAAAIKEEFEEEIEAKSGWGKNELKELMNKIILKVLKSTYDNHTSSE